MADCIECLAPLPDGQWSVHADANVCRANLRHAASALSLRVAGLEAERDALTAQLADAGVLRGDDAARLLASLSQTCSREEADRRTAEAREYLARVTTHPADHARAVLNREALGRVAYDAMFAEVRKVDADATDEWETDADARTAFATAAEAVARHVARAVLNAIRAVPVEDLLDAVDEAAGGNSLADDRDAEVIRARLLAAGEAAAEGRR